MTRIGPNAPGFVTPAARDAEAPTGSANARAPAEGADLADDFARGPVRRPFAGWNLGPIPAESADLRREISKSYAGTDQEGLRKMEEEAKKRRVLLQQSLAMNRGDPFLAARQTVRTERGGDVSNIAVNNVEQLEPEKKDGGAALLTFG